MSRSAVYWLGSVLDAAIGVMHQARRGLTQGDGSFESQQRQARGQGAVQRPSDHFTREHIQHHGQIDELRRSRM